MKEIPLTQGYVALVDDADYERVIQFKWCATVCRDRNMVRVYALTYIGGGAKTPKYVLMHNHILGKKGVDHADTNGLNNQRYNLRAANHSQNGANARFGHYGSSKWRGVSWCKARQKWEANIMKDRIKRRLGFFTEEWDAAQAYNFAAEELFGEFARFNQPKESN